MEDLFVERLITEIQSEFDLNREAAKEKLDESVFYELVEMDKSYVYHYPPSYWMKRLFKAE